MIVVALIAFIAINVVMVRLIKGCDYMNGNKTSKLGIWLEEQAYFAQYAYPTWAISNGFRQHSFSKDEMWKWMGSSVVFTWAELVELQAKAETGETMPESELYKLWLKGTCPCRHCAGWPAFRMPLPTRYVARRNVKRKMK